MASTLRRDDRRVRLAMARRPPTDRRRMKLARELARIVAQLDDGRDETAEEGATE